MYSPHLYSICGTKLRLWLRSWSSSLFAFPSLYDFLCANELKLTDNVKCDIAKHRSELGAQLRRYTHNWIHYPFHALPPVHLPISEQESLIEIATSSSVKIEFNQKPLPDFWIGLSSEFLALANCAVKTLIPFATTYLCESGFSALTSMKTKYRQCVCGKLFKTDSLQYNPTLQSYVNPFKHTFSLTCGELFTIYNEQIRFYM